MSRLRQSTVSVEIFFLGCASAVLFLHCKFLNFYFSCPTRPQQCLKLVSFLIIEARALSRSLSANSGLSLSLYIYISIERGAGGTFGRLINQWPTPVPVGVFKLDHRSTVQVQVESKASTVQGRGKRAFRAVGGRGCIRRGCFV